MNFFLLQNNVWESETEFGILTGVAVAAFVCINIVLTWDASKGECSLLHEFKGLWKPQDRLE